MHLLAAKPGGFSDDEGIVDLAQSAADIVILSAQDSSLGLLAAVAERLPDGYPSLRLANLMHLNKPAAYDLYEHQVLQHAKVIVVAVLGGMGYWRYGVEQLAALARSRGQTLVIVSGSDEEDTELSSYQCCDAALSEQIWHYLREGGRPNTWQLYLLIWREWFAAQRPPIQSDEAFWRSDWLPAQRIPAALIYQRDSIQGNLQQWLSERDASKSNALLLFYRSHVQSGNTGAFDDFIDILKQRVNVLPLALRSIKDEQCQATVTHLLDATDCDVVINCTSFAQHREGNASLSSTPQLQSSGFLTADRVVIQAIFAANDEQSWQDSDQGLVSRDIAMNVALPEFDGRIIARAVSFKTAAAAAPRSESSVVRYQLQHERAGFVADLAARWGRLRRTPNAQKKIALVLANYPTRDGRLGNGVGLDTPFSTLHILQALAAAGYRLDNLPATGDELVQGLLQGVTNDTEQISLRQIRHRLPLGAYQEFFQRLPEANQRAVMQRWGDPSQDPKFHQDSLLIAGWQFANVFVGIQPARGFNIDLNANYHDPDLVPPHSYLAFYAWLRGEFAADAVIHVGKHGNLEWLPGKSVGLSAECWPDAVFGPLPHLYPFIVNDPGEGAQAKRRCQAVIIDHLMPPMARAESHGDTVQLENLVDEYYQALGLDPRREKLLHKQILKALQDSHLGEELLHTAKTQQQTDPEQPAEDLLLNQLDAYLCDLKESQIRQGLHRLGRLPEAAKLVETLVSLLRLPRGSQPHEQGILHALAQDIWPELYLVDAVGDAAAEQSVYDPLTSDPALPWLAAKPACLQEIHSQPWRHHGDTRERLERLAYQLVDEQLQGQSCPAKWPVTAAVLGLLQQQILPALEVSASLEIGNTIAALSGNFVAPGPSGAPTRGRLDVLPTGRNFYSQDMRGIPTRSAWQLGQQSAEQLLLRHLQEHGEYPSELGISVWGTATMRTGGDDIAQALALLGVRPRWAEHSNRVIDVEVIPTQQLGRPRVDVTLRISGFFRDAFPNVVKLYDTAIQALRDYPDSAGYNTVAAHIQRDEQRLVDEGMSAERAAEQAGWRVFGSKPGSYGAGLQGLIDEGIWDNAADLAKAYVNWGGYSYSKQNFGEAAFQAFEQRLSHLQAVVQNQDNREHDLLDSDDYYQFQGGMSNAIRVLTGSAPAVYHGDNSNPAAPRMRTLKEELNRVVRSRVTNPKWRDAMQEHGYKGGFEMTASVDYLFAYDATTDLVDDYQYAAVSDALVLDAANQAFLREHNPDALKDMSERLLEAQQRGMWREPGAYAERLRDVLIDIDNTLEERSS